MRILDWQTYTDDDIAETVRIPRQNRRNWDDED
jgi:hypothetical protein